LDGSYFGSAGRRSLTGRALSYFFFFFFFFFFSLFFCFLIAFSPLSVRFVGAFVTSGADQGRLALRVVSIVHGFIAFFEFFETWSMRSLLWPPQIYGSTFDTTAKYWFEFAAAYYIWDLMTSIYTAYGFAFVIHGLLSFPVFLFASTGPRFFLQGFYGRFFHGVFALSTPWMHIRELLVASGRDSGMLKLLMEVLFVITYIVCRVILGTYVSVKFMSEMANMLLYSPKKVHNKFVFGVSILSCAVITFLQLYWFVMEILPAIMATLSGSPVKQE
jgi:hypothetical protein